MKMWCEAQNINAGAATLAMWSLTNTNKVWLAVDPLFYFIKPLFFGVIQNSIPHLASASHGFCGNVVDT
jgi:hypothetical protein